MKSWKKGVLLGCCLIFLIMILSIVFVAYKISNPTYYNECKLILPNNEELIFREYPTHPFLAEYDYKIVFSNGAVALLPTNTGGRTYINVYWYPKDKEGGAFVRLLNNYGNSYIDLKNHKAMLMVEYKKRTFIGDVTSSNNISSVCECDGEIDVEIYDHKAKEVTGSKIAVSKGEYIGAIDGESYSLRFVPLSERKERKIKLASCR